MDVVWECPVGVGEALLPSLVSTLVQSGIKLFLHQRNQIPLPLEQMAQKRNSILQRRQRNQEEDLPRGHRQVQDDLQPSKSEEESLEEESDLKERIHFMISQRRKNLNNLRRKRMAEKMSNREELAVESITNCLKMLDNQIQENFSHIVATGLFFGSSLHTAKEIVLFDLSNILKNDQAASVADKLECGGRGNEDRKKLEQFVSNLTRSFYKGIIMTDEFCDLTSKNLQSTRTHVCLLSNKKLNLSCDTEDTDDSVVLLDNVEIFTDYLCFDDTLDSASSSILDSFDSAEEQSFADVSTPPRFRRSNKKWKVLKIRLDMKTNNSTELQSIIRNTCNECLFCYKIPLRLKGIISCKNTFK